MDDDMKGLADAMNKILEQKNKQKLNNLKEFNSLEEILIHLANSSTKERSEFLKPWRNKSGKDGSGRKKNNDWEFWGRMKMEREDIERKNKKKFSSWKKFLQFYYKEKYPNISIEDADSKINTAENKISGIETIIKSIDKK